MNDALPAHHHHMRTEHSLAWRCAQVLARILTTVLFDLQVDGLENIPAPAACCWFPITRAISILLGVRLSRPLSYIAKSELFEYPIGSWLLRNIFNAFPVRQG